MTRLAQGAYNPRLVQQVGAKQIVVVAATDSGEPDYIGHGIFIFALTRRSCRTRSAG
jgi:hypothetical protein